MKFGVFIYEGVEPIDLATIGVLSMARRIAPEISFWTVAAAAGPVRLANGLTVIADYGFDELPPINTLIVTGGPGWQQCCTDQAALTFLQKMAGRATVASVCTGAMILAAAGLLEGQVATTKVEVATGEQVPLEIMRSQYPGIDVKAALLTDNGSIITGGGVSRCIDATLYLLEKYLGSDVADQTARIMEYTHARAANLVAAPIINNAANE